MKLIQVKKNLGNSGKYNIHYVNPNHIISIHEWSDERVLLLSNGDKLSCLDSLSDIMNQLED